MRCFRPRLAKNGKVSAANDHVRQLLMEWFVVDAGAYEAVERMETKFAQRKSFENYCVQELLQIFWHFIQDNSMIQTANLVYFPCVGKTDEKTSRGLQILAHPTRNALKCGNTLLLKGTTKKYDVLPFFWFFPHFSTANSDCVATLAISRKWHRQRPETRFEHGLANMFGDLNSIFFLLMRQILCKVMKWNQQLLLLQILTLLGFGVSLDLLFPFIWHHIPECVTVTNFVPLRFFVTRKTLVAKHLEQLGLVPKSPWRSRCDLSKSRWQIWVCPIYMFKHACCVYVCLCKSIGAHQLAHTRHQNVFDVVRAMWNVDVKDATIKWYCCIKLWKVG